MGILKSTLSHINQDILEAWADSVLKKGLIFVCIIPYSDFCYICIWKGDSRWPEKTYGQFWIISFSTSKVIFSINKTMHKTCLPRTNISTTSPGTNWDSLLVLMFDLGRHILVLTLFWVDSFWWWLLPEMFRNQNLEIANFLLSIWYVGLCLIHLLI